MCGGGSPGRAKIPTSPQATPSPSSPPTSSGFPVLFCRLYFTATSGVCLFPLQAPLLFPLLTFQKDHIRNTTKSTRFRTGFLGSTRYRSKSVDLEGRPLFGIRRSSSRLGVRSAALWPLRCADRWSVPVICRCAPEHRLCRPKGVCRQNTITPSTPSSMLTSTQLLGSRISNTLVDTSISSNTVGGGYGFIA